MKRHIDLLQKVSCFSSRMRGRSTLLGLGLLAQCADSVYLSPQVVAIESMVLQRGESEKG